MSEATPKKAEVKTLITPITPRDFRYQDHELQQWVAYVPPEAAKANLEDPQFWSGVCDMIRSPAEITVMASDGSWKAKVTILHNERNWAKAVVDQWFQYDNIVSPMIEDDLKVEHAGPHHKWRVVRRSDGEILSKENPDKETAERWKRNHLQSMSR